MISRRACVRLLLALSALAAVVITARVDLRAGTAVSISLSPFSTGIMTPIGIDQVDIPRDLAIPPGFCAVKRSALVISVNWAPTGNPSSSYLEIVDASGNRQQYSGLMNLPTQIKVAAVHVAAGGFTVGDVFVGNGGDLSAGTAGLYKISNGVATLFTIFPQDPSVPAHPRVVQSIFHDRYGAFGGDLLVLVTTDDDHPNHTTTAPTGQVWRVNAAGVATNVVSIQGVSGHFERHFEGVTTVPNLAAYGPVAGRVLVGAGRYVGQGPDQGSGGRIYAISPSGNIVTIGDLGVPADATHFLTSSVGGDPEDLDVIPSTGNFYGLDYGSGINDGRILTAPVVTGGNDFASRAGDVLVTDQNYVSPGSGLAVLHWNGTTFEVDPVTLSGGSSSSGHWEHVTFGPELKDCPIDLSVTKTVDNATPNVGGNVTFTVTVSNGPGLSTATGVTVDDVLPAGLTYVSSTTTQGTYAGGTWTVGQLASPATATMTITATVDTLGTKTNLAQVQTATEKDFDSTPGNAPGVLEDDDASVSVTPAATIDLSLTKTVSNATANVGSNVIFTVTVSNAPGLSPATGVHVKDLLPLGMTVVGVPVASQGSYNPATGDWNIGSLASPDSAVLLISASVDTAGLKNNAAEVSAADQIDVDSQPNNDPQPTVPHDEDDDDNVTVTPQQLDLSLTKTVDNATPNVGGNVVFTVTVTNGGPNGATGVAVGDLLPAGLAFVSATPSQGAYVSGTGVWTVGSLANGGSATLSITATATTIGAKTNTAEVTAADQADIDSTPNNHNPAEDDQASVVVTPQQIDLSLIKTVDTTTPNLGGDVVFTVTLANAGPSGATGVAVGDLLPAGLAFVSATPSQGAYVSGTGVWTVGALASGGSATLSITATVTTIGAKTNTAEVTAADQPDVDSTPNNHNPAEDDQASVTVTPQQIDLSLTKTVNTATPNLGGNVVFTVTLANAGPNGATGVAVGDLLPAGLAFVSATPSQGAYVSGTGVWTVGALASGGSATLSIAATVTTIGAKTNTAEVTTADQPDVDSTPNNHNPAEDDQASATVTPQQIDLSLTKTVNTGTPNLGGNVVFTVTLANAGPNGATGVAVGDLLPAGLAFVSATPSQGAYVSGTGVWTVGALASGGSATLSITATVTTIGAKTNTAEVTAADQPDVDSTPNNHNPAEDDQASVTVTPQQIDLSLTKTVNTATPNLGGNVVFTVTLANAGPNGATGVAVGDLLSAGLAFVSATPSQGAYVSGTGVWTVGSLASGGSATLAITATVTTIGAKTNTAEVTAADQPDVDSTPNNHNPAEDDQASVTVTPQQIDLSLTKTVNTATPDLGGNVVFTVTLANAGPNGATGVAVGDLLPAGLAFVSATPSQGAYVSGTGVWTVGSLASGGSATLAITATVTTIGAKTNTAEVTAADQPDVDSTPNNHNPAEDDQASVTVTPQQIDLSLTKTVNTATPNLGGNVVFTVTVLNSGPNTATTVTVKDVLPAGLTYVSDNGAGAYVSATGIWTVGTLTNGQSKSLQITATVASLGAKTNYAQVQTADQKDPDSTPGNNSTTEDDDDQVTVTPKQVDLSLTKTVNNATPTVGSNVVFTVTVLNSGPDTATTVTVKDVLPAGLTYVSDNGTGAYVSATGIWTVGTLTNGQSKSLQITATVASLGAKTNYAQVQTADQKDPDSTPGNNSTTEDDDDQVTVTPKQVDLSLTKTVNNATPTVGSNVVFTVTVLNSGPDTATTVTVKDVLPAGLAYVSDNGAGAYVSATGIWTVGTLTNGQSKSLQITAKATTTGAKTNYAQVQTADQKDLDSTPGNNSTTEDDDDQVTVTPIVPPATLGDFVWKDVNGNGLQDVGDTGLAGSTVTLWQCGPDGQAGTGDDVNTGQSVTTGISGAYGFANLAPACYFVTFTTPLGYTPSPANQGANDAIDSDVVSGRTGPYTLVSGQNNNTADAGFMVTPVCVPYTFTFTGNTPSTGAAGNIRSFTVNGVSVKASAFSRSDSSGSWSTAYLGLYGPGLGVTDGSESGADPNHKVDNVGGRDNYVLFEFSSPVVINRAFLDSIDGDSDVSFWIGTKADPFNSHLTLSDATLTSLGAREDNDTTNVVTSRWADINIGGVSGNVLVVAGSTSDSTPDDAFKISKLDIACPGCAAGAFTFTGNTASTGTAGNVRSFTSNGVSVKATAFSRSDATGNWSTAYLGLYGPGLGVTDGSESGSDPSHKVDNVGGRDNYVLFEFSSKVVINKAFLDSIGDDSDASFWIGTKTDPFNNHLTLSDATLTSLGTREDNDTAAVVDSRWADINAAGISGNVLVVAGSTSDTTPNDDFKISKLDVACK